MQYLKADTSVKVVIGPVVAVGDGFTPVTTLALSTADEAEIMAHDAAAVTDISGNTFAAITSADGYYNLTITAGQLATEGMLTVLINDDSLCLPVRHDYMVVNANVYDSLFAAATTDYLQVDAQQFGGTAGTFASGRPEVNTTHVSGTAQTANDNGADINTLITNIGTPTDLGSGATVSDNLSDINDDVGNIAVGSASISVEAESYTLTTGTQSSGTYTDTETKNAVRHEHTDTAGVMELYYQFNVTGNGVASVVEYWGYLTGGNDTLTVYAYDWSGASWDAIGTLNGGAASDAFHSHSVLTRHTGTGANLGKVRIRFYAGSGLTTATLAIDQIYVSYAVITQSVGYANGAVWIDTIDGVAGTESFVNGVADNPTNSLANAITIASNVGLDRFINSADTSITFAEAHTNEVWSGMGWTLALGGQDVSGIHVHNCQSLSGVCTSPTAEAHFVDCEVGAMSVGNSHFIHCGFSNTLTFTAATNYFLVDCYSQVAGSGSPTIDMGAAIGATNLSIRRWSGGITLSNLAAGDVVTLDGIFGTVTLNGADATVEIRGIAKAVTNNLTGSPTVNDDTLKTDIQEDWTDGGRLDLILDAILAMLDDPRAEPGQGAPAVNADLATKIDYLYKAWRNKSTQTSTTYSLYDDAGTTVDHKSTDSDDGTTATKGEIGAGP